MADIFAEPEVVSVLKRIHPWMAPHLDSGKITPGEAIPYRLVNYDIDNYRIRRGWPQPVPKIDIRAMTLVSVEGTTVEYRPDPDTVDTDAVVRWVASPQYYDQASLQWQPVVDGFGGWNWVTSPNFAPVMEEEYTYRVGTTLITHPCIDFSTETQDHFWSDFQGGLDNSSGFTVAMVVSLRATKEISGILCPGRPTPATWQFFDEFVTEGLPLSLMLRNNSLAAGLVEFPRPSRDIDRWLGRQAPMYIFLALDPPKLKLYTAIDPGTIHEHVISVGNVEGIPFNFVLGRSNGTVTETADMALFEMSFYQDALASSDVRTEMSKLAAIYGG